MTNFIAGLELNRAFYREAVAPILAASMPNTPYSAALLGPGSDVLGFDSERSIDHGWGPRLLLFLTETDCAAQASKVSDALASKLPASFRGFSTGFANPDAAGVRWMEPAEQGRVRHHVEITALRPWLRTMLGVDPDVPPQSVDWLLMPQQHLLEVTGGEIFHDGLGELSRIRSMLAWYPDDVWIFMMASQWMRIAQEEPFAGRCAEAGDEIGSRMIAARLVRDLMRLCFLIERRYAPYGKWLGSAFARLRCAAELRAPLKAALGAPDFAAREMNLCIAYEAAARMHNALGITAAIAAGTELFHDRPYRVLNAERFARVLLAAIRDSGFARVCAQTGPIGGIDQFADSTNLTDRSDLCARLRALFEVSA
jgi:Domain of unknown function (DUF4037)